MGKKTDKNAAYFDPLSESRDERAARLKAAEPDSGEPKAQKPREIPIVETPA